jgi:hypothetical protein
MQTFTCLFEDERYNVPTLSFFVTADEERARELARRELNSNLHYSGFELSAGNKRLLVESLDERALSGRSADLA